MNFGLREAVFDSLDGKNPYSSFISAERVQDPNKISSWHVEKTSYKQFELKNNSIIFTGDVVATGTSLKYILTSLTEFLKEKDFKIRELY